MTKTILEKLNCTLCMLAFFAGIICFACAFYRPLRLPENVTVNGLEVGRLTRAEAVAAVREQIESELKTKTLEIRVGESVYSYSYPEIYYKDNLYALTKNVKKNSSYTAEMSYYLCGLNEVAAGICAAENRSVTEPYAEFTATGAEAFKYFEGCDGRKVDKAKLISDVKLSLSGGFETVTASVKTSKRKRNLEDIKGLTRKISSFTTYFDGGNLSRASNIRLAAAKLNGKVLNGGKTLSFNDIVGARVRERGFLPAKIIENGEFTEGVGGGVCQVSTTLYNAALLAGLKISEYHPHSLAVSYVPPSRDAMVSGSAFDLKIVNTSKNPVYIRARTSGGSVTFEIYGADDGAEYSISSEVTGSIPADEEATDDPAKAREGRDGTLSEGYLVINRGGYEKRVLLRRDKYLPVKKLTYGATGAENVENAQIPSREH